MNTLTALETVNAVRTARLHFKLRSAPLSAAEVFASRPIFSREQAQVWHKIYSATLSALARSN